MRVGLVIGFGANLGCALGVGLLFLTAWTESGSSHFLLRVTGDITAARKVEGSREGSSGSEDRLRTPAAKRGFEATA